jgi:thiamine-phosphate pyrophosphorylase
MCKDKKSVTLMNLDLYVITDEEAGCGLSHGEIARRAIAGGADVIQLRDKTCGSGELLRTARVIREITAKTGTLFIVNDSLDVALISCADGVHLGQDDLGAGVARQLTPSGFIIGVSVGSLEEAVRAERAGADYLALSPVFPTASKHDAGPGHGLELLQEIRQNVIIPVIAIGGITKENVHDVITAGADGIAVISAVVGSQDIIAAAKELKEMVLKSRMKMK